MPVSPAIFVAHAVDAYLAP